MQQYGNKVTWGTLIMSPIKNNPSFMVWSWFYEDKSNFQPHYIKPLNLLM